MYVCCDCLQIDMASFMTLTDGDLRELGITTFGARRKLLLAIAGLSFDFNIMIGVLH